MTTLFKSMTTLFKQPFLFIYCVLFRLESIMVKPTSCSEVNPDYDTFITEKNNRALPYSYLGLVQDHQLGKHLDGVKTVTLFRKNRHGGHANHTHKKNQQLHLQLCCCNMTKHFNTMYLQKLIKQVVFLWFPMSADGGEVNQSWICT